MAAPNEHHSFNEIQYIFKYLLKCISQDILFRVFSNSISSYFYVVQVSEAETVTAKKAVEKSEKSFYHRAIK